EECGGVRVRGGAPALAPPGPPGAGRLSAGQPPGVAAHPTTHGGQDPPGRDRAGWGGRRGRRRLREGRGFLLPRAAPRPTCPPPTPPAPPGAPGRGAPTRR